MTSLLERVARWFPPDASERAFLAGLETNLLQKRRGEVIVGEGAPALHAFVLRKGWAMSYTGYPDGSSQVRRLHFPGDLLGMPSLPMRHHAEDIEALSDCEIAIFPKAALTEVFRLPRLAAILYMFAHAERLTLGDRLASLGHNRAKARVAFLLIDILHRLRSVDPSVRCTFDMRLTREQIGYVTGISAVHASRSWSELISEGLISCSPHQVTILSEARLEELACYRDHDRDFDVDWLHMVEHANGARLELQ
jgi:CRP/FNR family transcriptional regulator, anaerobic regulatory protein